MVLFKLHTEVYISKQASLKQNKVLNVSKFNKPS